MSSNKETIQQQQQRHAKAVVDTRGRRTGVFIYSQEVSVSETTGLEDPDVFFDNATLSLPSTKMKENNHQENQKSSRTATSGKMTRFSVGSVNQADDSFSASASASTRWTGKVKRLMGKIHGLTSPSELSSVSTAPASPLRPRLSLPPAEKDDDEEEQVHALRNGSTEDLPSPIVQQDDNDEDDDEEEEQPRQTSNFEKLNMETDEEIQDIHPAQDDDMSVHVEEDDFMPPGPPDSPEPGDESTADFATQDEHEEIPTQMPSDTYDDVDGDADDDGPGFSMPSSKTPESAKIVRKPKKKQIETSPEKKKKFVKKRNVQETRAYSEEEEEEEEEHQAEKKVSRKAKKTRIQPIFSPKGIRLPLEYEAIPVDALREKNITPGLRRSNRARCPPLAYWKNEKPIYGPPPDDADLNPDVAKMPIVHAILRAKETPYKPLTIRSRIVSGSGKKKVRRDTVENETPVEREPFDSSKLQKKYVYTDEEDIPMWDDYAEKSRLMRVVSHTERLAVRKLPCKDTRTKAEGNVVGLAAQAFLYEQEDTECSLPGYLMGSLTLPPKGIKDAESVGACAQAFTVVSCQPGALEVAFADPEEGDRGSLKPEKATRCLLKPGDMFRVPPGNCYRLQNHSKTTECVMTWTIIRPFRR